jgi:hypothetical protein
MARIDKDSSCRQESVKILLKMNQAGFLDDLDYDKFVVLLMDQCPKIRKLVTPGIQEWTKSEFADVLENEYESTRVDEYSKESVELKGICQMLQRVCELVDSPQSEPIAKNTLESKGNHLEWKGNKNYDVLNSSKDDLKTNLEHWISEYNSDENDVYCKVEIAVITLFKEFPILSNLEFITSFLGSDFSNPESVYVPLSDSEELILTFILSSSIRYMLENEQVEARKSLTGNIVKLIQKYHKQYSGTGSLILLELLDLTSLIDQTYFNEIGITEVFNINRHLKKSVVF